MRNLLSIGDLTNDEIDEIFDLADCADKLRADKCATGQIMATLFYEPSTRTRLSFESAMHRLGGAVISCSDMKASSAAKGESLADTARVVSSYADVLVVRHYWDGAVQAVAEHAAGADPFDDQTVVAIRVKDRSGAPVGSGKRK